MYDEDGVERLGGESTSYSDNYKVDPSSKLGPAEIFDGTASGYLGRPIIEPVGKECESNTGGEDGGDDCCESADRSPESDSEALAVDIVRSGLGCRILRTSASDGFAFPDQPFRIPFDFPMLPAADVRLAPEGATVTVALDDEDLYIFALSNWNGSMPESGRTAAEGRRMRSVAESTLLWLTDDSPREWCEGENEESDGLGSEGIGGGMSMPLFDTELFRHRLRKPRTDITELLRDRLCFESCSKPCSESAENRLDCVSTSAFSGTEGGSTVPCNRDGGRVSEECTLSLETRLCRKSSTGRLPKGSGERGITGEFGSPFTATPRNEGRISWPSPSARALVSSETSSLCCPFDARLSVN